MTSCFDALEANWWTLSAYSDSKAKVASFPFAFIAGGGQETDSKHRVMLSDISILRKCCSWP